MDISTCPGHARILTLTAGLGNGKPLKHAKVFDPAFRRWDEVGICMPSYRQRGGKRRLVPSPMRKRVWVRAGWSLSSPIPNIPLKMKEQEENGIEIPVASVEAAPALCRFRSKVKRRAVYAAFWRATAQTLYSGILAMGS